LQAELFVGPTGTITGLRALLLFASLIATSPVCSRRYPGRDHPAPLNWPTRWQPCNLPSLALKSGPDFWS